MVQVAQLVASAIYTVKFDKKERVKKILSDVVQL